MFHLEYDDVTNKIECRNYWSNQFANRYYSQNQEVSLFVNNVLSCKLLRLGSKRKSKDQNTGEKNCTWSKSMFHTETANSLALDKISDQEIIAPCGLALIQRS